MTVNVVLPDARTTARIVNLAYRMGCRVEAIAVDARTARCDAVFDFAGTDEALRRLDAQISRVLVDEGMDGR